MIRIILSVSLMLILALGAIGCRSADGPDYDRQLSLGASGLRKITDPAEWPDLTGPFQGSNTALLESIDRSMGWFEKPSSRQFFPSQGITHDQARASVLAMRHLLSGSGSPQAFEQAVRQNFDCYTSVGYDGSGTVLYTGYYSPIFNASRVQTPEYRYPLYRRPADLESDPVTGKTLGRRVGDTVVSYPRRAAIENSNLLAGQELVWLRDRFEQYLAHIQGSARLTLTDGGTMYVGFAGYNGHEYTSISRELVREGKLDRNRINLKSVREYFQKNPQDLDTYIRRNDRFVFFREYDGGTWPSGSLGVKVTTMRSLATDKSVFPRGGVTLAVTRVSPVEGQWRRFEQLMADQDTGGAIRAAGRADIYMGVGAEAEQIAGRQYAEGRLYYFFLKPERVPSWLRPEAMALK